MVRQPGLDYIATNWRRFMRYLFPKFALAFLLASGLSGCDYVHYYECFDARDRVVVGHAKTDGSCDCIGYDCPGVPKDLERSDLDSNSNVTDGGGTTCSGTSCGTLTVRSGFTLGSQIGTPAQSNCVSPTNGDQWQNRGTTHTWSRSRTAVINVSSPSYSHCVDPSTGLGWGVCGTQMDSDESMFIGATPSSLGCYRATCTAITPNTTNWYCPAR